MDQKFGTKINALEALLRVGRHHAPHGNYITPEGWSAVPQYQRRQVPRGYNPHPFTLDWLMSNPEFYLPLKPESAAFANRRWVVVKTRPVEVLIIKAFTPVSDGCSESDYEARGYSTLGGGYATLVVDGESNVFYIPTWSHDK